MSQIIFDGTNFRIVNDTNNTQNISVLEMKYNERRNLWIWEHERENIIVPQIQEDAINLQEGNVS